VPVFDSNIVDDIIHQIKTVDLLII